ncbi:MAG: hypothetical protein JWL83_1038 [Actinomycetia bacterium]|nr:hypothetical protein [Actinomycetes bacterium]
MPKRTLGYRGFGLTLEVPENIGRVIRRVRRERATPTENLVVAPPPAFEVDTRDRQRRYWSEFVANASRDADAQTSETDADVVSSHPWYHTIDLLDGSVTPGRFDHRRLVPHYGLPADLRGKTALDVGSGDGFWAFELERLGAEVTSLDVETFADVDLPRALHAIFVERPVNLSFRRGFEMAHRRRGSRIKLINEPIYDLDPDEVGTFDFVHAGDILLHLRDPALALQRLRTVTAGECLIADCFDPALDALGVGPGLTRYRGGWDDVTWWTPALSTLVQMVIDAGFADVEVVTTYSLADRGSAHGPWRAVLRARP